MTVERTTAGTVATATAAAAATPAFAASTTTYNGREATDSIHIIGQYGRQIVYEVRYQGALQKDGERLTTGLPLLTADHLLAGLAASALDVARATTGVVATSTAAGLTAGTGNVARLQRLGSRSLGRRGGRGDGNGGLEGSLTVLV